MQLLAFGRREEIPTSSHVCQLYSKPDEVAQIASGLFAGTPSPDQECCVYVGPAPIAAQVEAQLRAQEIDVDGLKEAGRLVISSDRSEYLSQNRFDPFFLLSAHLNLINRARKSDLAGVRLAMEMSWLSENVATPAQVLKYEAMCDSVFTFQRQPIIAIAQYNYSRLGDQIAGEMMKLHPLAYVGRNLKRNPSYLNSEQYFLNILNATRKRSEREF